MSSYIVACHYSLFAGYKNKIFILHNKKLGGGHLRPGLKVKKKTFTRTKKNPKTYISGIKLNQYVYMGLYKIWFKVGIYFLIHELAAP
jgi:hypothetical protein